MSRETGIMSKEDVKLTLDNLRKIQKHCCYEECKNCIFNTFNNPCIFFDKPWEWDLGALEEKLF